MIRWQAVLNLAGFKHPLIIKNLTPLISDKHSRVRASLIDALEESKDPGILGALISALRDKDGEIRVKAAISLCQLGDIRAMEALIQSLSDNYVNPRCYIFGNRLSVRSFAIEYFANMKSTLPVEPLFELSSEIPTVDIRASIAFALSEIGTPRALEILDIIKGSDPDGDIREYDSQLLSECQLSLFKKGNPSSSLGHSEATD